MNRQRPERLGREHRLRSPREFREVQTRGTVLRGTYCTILVLAAPATPTRFGFITSRKSLGIAVRRNRARRRLREIIRRRFPRMPHTGYWLVVIGHRGLLDATHQELATEVERLLARAGALEPLEVGV